MLICVKGEKTQPQAPPTRPKKENTQRQKERQEKSMLWQSEEEEKKNRERLRLRHSPCLPPPSWKHRVRALSLHVLIMINAGTTTHTLKPRFWQGSGPALCSDLWFCAQQLTLSSGLLKVPVHKAVKFQEDSSAQRFSLDISRKNRRHQNLATVLPVFQNHVHTLVHN